MSWYTGGRFQRVTFHVLRAEVADMPLDCEDHDRIHVWITSMHFLHRRAMVLPGDEVFRAFWRAHDMSEENIATRLDPAGPFDDENIETYLAVMSGKERGLFSCEMEEPPPEAEGGERIEMRELTWVSPGELDAMWQRLTGRTG